jgi:hypothetical protein
MSFLALSIVFMMLVSSAAAMAGPTPDQVDDARDLDPASRYVRILDITGYPDDDDGDGLYDGIQIVSRVNFTRGGDYYLHVKLMPTDGSWWLSAAETQRIDGVPEEKYFEVRFEGWKIQSRNYTGYLVAEVSVLNPATNAVLDTYRETLDQYFRVWEWEGTWTGARVTGFGTAVPLDFDGNGMYELAELPVLIETRSPGLYRVILYYTWERDGATSVDGRLNQYSITNWTQLEEGANEVPMWISGAHIRQSSSMTFKAYVYKGAFPGTGNQVTLTVDNPESYEAPTLRGIYRDTHVEVAKDNDLDGTAEALRISVGLDVDIPGDYTFTAVLGPAGTLPYDRATADTSGLNRLLADSRAAKSTMTWTYEPGDRWAWFTFDGRLLNTWDYDGAYDVIVFAWGPKPTIGTSFKFTTKEFSADQFVHPVPPLQFSGGHTDQGVMNPQTGLFDGLKVVYSAKINMPGTYTAFAVLYYEGQEIAYNRVKGFLPIGDAQIPMTFPGDAIYNSRARGTFTAVIWVTGAGVVWNDTTLEHPMTTRYETGAYSWEMFSPPDLRVGPKDPQPVEDLDYILLRTGLMVVRVDRDRPDLTFYMTDDDGRTALFRVVYNRLLAFTDVNDDGAPQAGEVAYTSPLLAYEWELSEVRLVEDAEMGRVATFDLTATIDLVENDPLAAELGRPLFTVEDFAKVTLTFTLTSRDVNHTNEVGQYTTLGGAELKVDIRIDVMSPVEGIDFLTVEQVLKDDRGTYLPKTTEEDADGEPTPDELRRYRETADLKQRIEFRERAATPAFYSWVKKAEVTRADGTEEVTDVLAAYLVTDGRMVLYLSYPYDVETISIYHDPSLGIFEGGFPGIPEEWRAIFDPLLFGVSAMAAVAMVVALRSKSRREDEEMEAYKDEDEDEMEAEGEPLDVTPEKGPPEGPEDGPRGIPELPDGPRGNNGSTILPQPPPTPPVTPPPEARPEEWAEWQD